MAVPTRVLEGGQWVTRLLDPYQILVQNRSHLESKPSDAVRPMEPPTCALLTRTLVRSPVLRSIHPAMIRHHTKNDMVFVSEDTVQLKEAFQDYTMSTVLTESNFGSHIRIALVFNVTNPNQMTEKSSRSDGVKVKIENEAAMTSCRVGQTPIKYPASPYLPPQILIVVLESSKVMFVYTTSGLSRHPEFSFTQKPLPYFSRRTHQLGEHIAVDPLSRALVIAAQEKYFYLYALKPADLLRHELEQNGAVMPIGAERSFAVDGIILHCAFLHPEPNDHDHVILLLIVSKKGTSKLVWFEWDIKAKLLDAPLVPNFFSLPREHVLPLLLVPLHAFNSFLLVNRSNASVYRDILTGTPASEPINLIKDDLSNPAIDPDFRNSPLWISWARPVRYRTSSSERNSAVTKDDNIYLCREDGLIKFVDINHVRNRMIDGAHNAGQLHTAVDGAFTVIDLGPNHDDMLVASGQAGSAGLWRLSARQTAEPIFSQMGWAPVRDCTVIPSSQAQPTAPTQAPGSLEMVERPMQLLVGAARSRYGSINEIRFGWQADPLGSIDLQGVINDVVLDVFLLSPFEHLMLILVSHPMSSSLLWLQEGMQPELLGEADGMLLGYKTLSAAISKSGILCQVTSHSIMCSSPRRGLENTIHWQRQFENPFEKIMAACFDIREQQTFMAFSMQRDGAYFIQVLLITESYTCVGGPFQTFDATTGLAIHISEHRVIVAAANTRGTVEIFALALQAGFDQSFQKIAEGSSVDCCTICDSIAILAEEETNAQHEHCLIVCGLRNGHICTFQLVEHSWNLLLVEQISVGNTTVSLKKAETSLIGVVLLCDYDLYTLIFPRRFARPIQSVLRLIPVHNSQTSDCTQSRPFAFTQIVDEGKQPGFSSFVIISSKELLFVNVNDPERGIVTRRWMVGGTPVCTLFSGHLQKLLMLCSEIHSTRRIQQGGARYSVGKRARRPVVNIVDVSQGSKQGEMTEYDSDIHSSSAVDPNNPRYPLSSKRGEKFLGMTEWLPVINGSKFHLLLFNTLIKDRKRPATGRLLFYAVAKAEDNGVDLQLKKTLELASPVHCVAPHPDGSSIVYCSGTDLNVVSLEPTPSTIKFGVSCQTRMRSHARRITVDQELIYVSTATESLQVYRYVDNRLTHWTGDAIARNGINHTMSVEPNLVLASDMSGSITGMWQPDVEHANHTMATIFDAALPRATTRLIPFAQCRSKIDLLVPGRGVLIDGKGTNKILKDTHSQKDLLGPQFLDYRSQAWLSISTDGTIVQLIVLKMGWKLLKQIQQMCEQDVNIHSWKAKRRSKRVEPSSVNPRFLHIDGDLLQRLLSGDPVRKLEEMTGTNNSPDENRDAWTQDSNLSSEAQRFIDSSKELFGAQFVDARSKHDLCCEVVRWVEYVMRAIVI